VTAALRALLVAKPVLLLMFGLVHVVAVKGERCSLYSMCTEFMEFYLVGLMNAGQLGFCPPLANCRDSVLLCCSFAAINTSNLYERSTLAIYSSMWLSSDAGSHLVHHRMHKTKVALCVL